MKTRTDQQMALVADTFEILSAKTQDLANQLQQITNLLKAASLELNGIQTPPEIPETSDILPEPIEPVEMVSTWSLDWEDH